MLIPKRKTELRKVLRARVLVRKVRKKKGLSLKRDKRRTSVRQLSLQDFETFSVKDKSF